MRNLFIVAVIASSLAGCASRPAPAVVGNFADRAVPAHGKAMADDAARKLVALYPPARTRFNLRQSTPDAFGASLVTALRAKGYALSEFLPAPAAVQPASTAPGTSSQSGDASLAYVVDQPLEAGQYRVTVLVNNQSLSRLYEARDGAIAPAGYWIRKE